MGNNMAGSTTIILFRGIAVSTALQANIREHIEHLRRFVGDMRACKVVVTVDGRRHHHGNQYRVHIHLTHGTREIDTGRARAHGPRHEDPYVAVADAFDAMRRRVENHAHWRGDGRRGRRAAVAPGGMTAKPPNI
ncbi:MAG: HPF/RaiA family ribosome-associated protein [Rudaea sp.]